jgi:hypothetical protein
VCVGGGRRHSPGHHKQSRPEAQSQKKVWTWKGIFSAQKSPFRAKKSTLRIKKGTLAYTCRPSLRISVLDFLKKRGGGVTGLGE